MAQKSFLGLLTWAIFHSAVAFGQGGPPLITDDPDTPGDGHWEINLAGISEFNSNSQLTSFPYVDANYGWGDRIQLKFETGWNYAVDTDSSSHRGAGASLAGVKWRFLDQKEDGISVSTYPQFEFRSFFASVDPAVSDPGTRLLLPLEVSGQFGFLIGDAELGYAPASLLPNEWFYGLILAHELGESDEVMVELHGTTLTNGGGTELLFNVGSSIGLREWASLIFSFGHTLTTELAEPGHFLGYLGVQLRL